MPPACSQRRNESSQITEKTLPYLLRSDPGSILGVVTVILLAYQIHNLRRAARDAVKAFDNLQRLLECEVNFAALSFVGSFGEEDLHHQALVILVKPGALWLTGFAPIIVLAGGLVIRRPQGGIVESRLRPLQSC